MPSRPRPRVGASRSPFEVTLVSKRTVPGKENFRRYVFDVTANMKVQRYEIDAVSYEVAENQLEWMVYDRVRHAGDIVDNKPSAYYNARESRRSSGAVIVVIVGVTLAARWVAGKVFTWLHSDEEAK